MFRNEYHARFRGKLSCLRYIYLILQIIKLCCTFYWCRDVYFYFVTSLQLLFIPWFWSTTVKLLLNKHLEVYFKVQGIKNQKSVNKAVQNKNTNKKMLQVCPSSSLGFETESSVVPYLTVKAHLTSTLQVPSPQPSLQNDYHLSWHICFLTERISFMWSVCGKWVKWILRHSQEQMIMWSFSSSIPHQTTVI